MLKKHKNITLFPNIIHDFTICNQCKKQIPDMNNSYIEQTKSKSPGVSDRIIKARVICEKCKIKIYD